MSGAPTLALEFVEVTRGGLTKVVLRGECPPPPAGFRFLSPSVYLEVETNATYAGPISLCLDPESLPLPGILETIRLMEYRDGEWFDITEAVDPESLKIWGTTDVLGLLAIVQSYDPVAGLNDLSAKVEKEIIDLLSSRT